MLPTQGVRCHLPHACVAQMEGSGHYYGYSSCTKGSDMWIDMWRGVPIMPFLTRVPMSGQRWMGYMSLRITPMFMGHVSLGGLNEGHFHRGRCQAACCFGVRFQATCLLGSLGFWFLINSGLQTFQATFSDILSFRASSSSSSILHFCFCNFGHYSPFPTVSLFFPSLLQASLVSASGCLFQILVSPFFLYIGFFFFTIHLVVVGVVFGVCDFLDVKWTL